MTVRVLLGAALMVAVAVPGGALSAQTQAQGRRGAAPAGAVRTVNITVNDPVGDKMEYSVKRIVAKPGERIRVRLTSIAQIPKVVMAHNFILLRGGADPKAFSDAAAMAGKERDFIPPTLRNQILAQTPLLGPGERAEVVFTAPTQPGKYVYLCSFAGHYAAGMWGELIVQ